RLRLPSRLRVSGDDQQDGGGDASRRAGRGDRDGRAGASGSLRHGGSRGMILLIDNYDSFTYNLYQFLCELGATVEVRRNDKITVPEIRLLAPEAIVISPGPCTPAE